MSDKKEKKRELILDKAFEIILEKGYSGTKIIDIANMAGIGKGTVYEYFESKEALLLELINTRVRQDYMRVCDAMTNASGCKQKLTQYFLMQLEVTAKYKPNVTDFRNEFMGNNTEISTKIVAAIHDIVSFMFERVYNVIKDGIDSGEFKNIDPGTATACFIGSISFYMGMLHDDAHCQNYGKFQPPNQIQSNDTLLDCIFNGLAT